MTQLSPSGDTFDEQERPGVSAFSPPAHGEEWEALARWSGTQTISCEGECLHHLFEARAADAPDAVALVFEEQRLSYAEVNGRANQLAHHLLGLGVRPESGVAVFAEPSPEMVVACFGVVKAGGAIIFLDVAYPQERIAYTLEETGAAVLLTTSNLVGKLPQHAARVVLLDADREAIERGPATNPPVSVSPDNLAWIAYTSGTTGRPKGTLIEHRALYHASRNARLAYDLKPGSRFFDLYGFGTLNLTLPNGGTAFLARRTTVLSPPDLLELLRRHAITQAAFPPSLLTLLPEAETPGLETVTVGGERVSKELVARWAAGRRFFLNYSCTESLLGTRLMCDGRYQTQPSIGRPVENAQIYLLDARLNPVPAGEVGEIHIGGAGLARGYLGRPALTAERFIPHPFSAEPGARLYRTGDLARHLPDGQLEYLGRADQQVKVRGHRVELTEVEAVLNQHPRVRKAAVALREGGPAGARLVAYVVAASDGPLPVREVHSFLKGKLLDYMLPSAYVQLENLPLTPNGKIDRLALPDTGQSVLEPGGDFTPPSTPLEKRLADIWSGLLGVEQVGLHDDFFESGGHSLLAAQLVSRISAAFQVDVPLRALFEAPTVAGLSAHVGEAMQGPQGLSWRPIARAARDAELPLSFSQGRLWLLDQLEQTGAAYNLPLAVRLKGALDAQALERSLQEIVRRHEVLRTNFTQVDGQPRQVINPARGFSLTALDLCALAEGERESAARAAAEEEARRPFDLSKDSLLRAKLLRLRDDEHALLVTTHHIVSDGWSLGVFVRELRALYEAFSRGADSPLPPLPIQYADFAVWQRECLRGETLQARLEYWKEHLAGAPPVLALPTDRPRPAAQSFRGARHAFTLGGPLTESLKSLSRREGATLFTTLLAAFETLLYRYTGQGDFVLGTAVANRNRVETEGLIGFFVNTLALRARLDAGLSFRELLSKVRAVALDAQAHQDVPFEMLVEALQPERDMSRSPLFQVMFILQNAAPPATNTAGLELEPLEVETRSAQFDLSLSMAETEHGLKATIDYSTDLFDAETIERMASHFGRLLAGAAAAPDLRLSELPLLGEEERHQLLVEFNRTSAEYPADTTLHELFERQAALTPEAVALVYEDETLTYAELDRRSEALAARLRRLGVGAEQRVGLVLERSAEMVVGVLGVLKAGGAYVPIDPAYPAERQRLMMEDAGVRLALTQRHLAGGVAAGGWRVLAVDEPWETAEGEDGAECRDGRAAADNLAYVIYTSGSTGRPKGVMISHRAVVNFLHSMRRRPGLTSDDVLLAVTTLSFDIAGLEIFLPLLAGARLVVLGRDAVSDANRIREKLAGQGVTVMQATPATWRLLLEDGWQGGGQLKVLCGGEALTPDLAARLFTRCASVWNMYGPTETTIWSTLHRVESEKFEGSIGRPIANTSVYILDDELQPCPLGVVGELYIGGDGVARGYSNRPDLTAERFIPHPFAGRPGARMYRTGDHARYLPGGDIEYAGRADNQVKVRGFRIELREVEAALEQHGGVRQAVVTAREGAAGDKRLVAYWVGEGGVPAQPSELRAFLKGLLPEYMLPAAYVRLDSFPLTSSGKVDRRALPAPEYSRDELSSELTAPRTPVEEVVVGVWADVLGLSEVGVHDNFFELGGHSLLATRVMSRVREILRADVPLRALFETPSVAGLAEQVEGAMRAGGGDPLPPIEPSARGENPPLSFGQERLWFLNQLEPDTSAYNISCALRLRGALDAAVLEQTFTELVRRHEVLRTNFVADAGRPKQVILPPRPCALPLTDLSPLPEGEREATAQRLAWEEMRVRFDLSKDMLLRARLLRLNEDEHVLLVVMHHIIADGWSLGVLVREAAALYGALARGGEAELPRLPLQYADYAEWQRRWLGGETLEAQLAYWRRQLAGAPAVLHLPTDRPRKPLQAHRGERLKAEIPEELYRELKALGRREGVTLFMTLLAAFNALLQRYTGQADIVVGTPVAGRQHARLEGLIGLFVNTLALRTDLSGGPSARELLRRVRETALGAYARQDVPFEKVVEALQPERSTSHTPLFQVMLTLDHEGPPELDLPGVTSSPLSFDIETAKFELTLGFREHAGGLSCSFEYNADLFDRATVARMSEHLQTLLRGMVADPCGEVFALPLMGEAEERQLLAGWSGTRADYPSDCCVQQLFEARVEKTPDAVAVISESGRLTYRELNERANRLARGLRRLGAGPESYVVLFAGRSVEMLVGLLGILKSGAAYVPVDPLYPRERVSYILENTRASIILTEERLLPALPQGATEVVLLDRDAGRFAGEDARNLNPAADPANTCYVIYTSGSTGTPKGVLVTHRSLVNHAAAVTKHYELREDDRVLQAASVGFDVMAEEVFPTLLCGAAVVIAPEQASDDFVSFLRLLKSERLTVVNLPTSFWQALTEEATRARLELPSSLRLVIVGSEAAHAAQAESWPQLLGENTRWCNAYGLTETTITTTIFDPRRSRFDSQFVPIGRPIANTRVYVLDARLRPAPPGVTGELFIGGDGLARGYLARPALTAERFIPDPFGAEPGGRLYRTGDLARWLAGGELEFAGRADEQVKVRGFRIEPGEIEAALRRHSGVREAAVVISAERQGRERLVAYVVGAQGRAVDVRELKEHLAASLPRYMQPSAFVVLDELPRTAHGKLDRQALPAPESVQGGTDDGRTEGLSPVEGIVAGMWAELLGLEQVGRVDNFFELGGHSLLATQLMSRVRDVFDLEVPLRVLFERPTLAEFAEGVEAVRKAGEAFPAPPLKRVTRAGVIPLSFAQQRIWFMEQLGLMRAAYNMAGALRLSGELDVNAMGRAVAEVVRRHEILRTNFPVVDGNPVQSIAPELDFALALTDLGRLPEPEAEAEAARLAAEETRRPFDLTRDPLLRVKLLRLKEQEYLLLFTMHHIIADGWSVGVLVKEVAALYAAFAAGGPSTLPALPVQYADYTLWQREWLQAGVLESQLAYWRRRLSGAPAELNLPFDHARPARMSNRGAWESLRLSPELSRSVEALSRRENVTLFMTLLAAFQTLLRSYTGQDDIVVGTDIANRRRGETEHLIGFFANQLVLRGDLSGDPTFRELLRRLREVCLEAYSNQDVPFERLVEELQPRRDLSRHPLFQVMFILQNAPTPALELPGLSLRPWPVEEKTAIFDLSLSCAQDQEGRIQLSMRYRTELFEPGTVARMLRHLENVLRGVCARPEARLGELEIHTEGEMRQQAEAKRERKEARLKKLLSTRPKAVEVSQDEPVRSELMDLGEMQLPVMRPAAEGVSPAAWAGSNREMIERTLLRHGAVLFRHFDARALGDFEQVARAVSPQLIEYGERSSPRTRLGDGLYTSTDYPAEHHILLHNEQSYTQNWPMKIWFFCVRPADSGGRTPVADSRRIFARLRPAVVEAFARKEVMYVRNYGDGLGLPWPEVFQTADRAEVEEHCRRAGIRCEWKGRERLRTYQVRPAVRTHPKTGEWVWFNHALFFHVTSLGAEMQRSLQTVRGEDLPFNTYYGDGSPIEPSVLDEIREAYRLQTVSFAWEAGDILLLDNMLTAHGREPFEGPRKIVVAMAEPFDGRED